MRKIDYELSHLAHETALKSTMNRRLGAIVADGKKILSFGYNRYTGVEVGINQWSIHAEVDALSRVFNNTDDKGLTLYIIRKGFLLSKPCKRCMKALGNSGVSRVVYSDSGGLREIRI